MQAVAFSTEDPLVTPSYGPVDRYIARNLHKIVMNPYDLEAMWRARVDDIGNSGEGGVCANAPSGRTLAGGRYVPGESVIQVDIGGSFTKWSRSTHDEAGEKHWDMETRVRNEAFQPDYEFDLVKDGFRLYARNVFQQIREEVLRNGLDPKDIGAIVVVWSYPSELAPVPEGLIGDGVRFPKGGLKTKNVWFEPGITDELPISDILIEEAQHAGFTGLVGFSAKNDTDFTKDALPGAQFGIIDSTGNNWTVLRPEDGATCNSEAGSGFYVPENYLSPGEQRMLRERREMLEPDARVTMQDLAGGGSIFMPMCYRYNVQHYAETEWKAPMLGSLLFEALKDADGETISRIAAREWGLLPKVAELVPESLREDLSEIARAHFARAAHIVGMQAHLSVASRIIKCYQDGTPELVPGVVEGDLYGALDTSVFKGLGDYVPGATEALLAISNEMSATLGIEIPSSYNPNDADYMLATEQRIVDTDGQPVPIVGASNHGHELIWLAKNAA